MRAWLQSQGLSSVFVVRVRATFVRAAQQLPLRLHINEESLMSGRTRPTPAASRMIQRWQWQ